MCADYGTGLQLLKREEDDEKELGYFAVPEEELKMRMSWNMVAGT